MKYAIRHIGTSEFLSNFDSYGDPEWVQGWDNSDMLLYPTLEEAQKDLEKAHGNLYSYLGADSPSMAMIEEITKMDDEEMIEGPW